VSSRPFLRFAWLTLALAVAFGAGARAEDFWGKKLPDQPMDFIFGYGSLINTASRDSSVKKPIAAIPVRVSARFGFIRTWNERSPTGFTALGLRRATAGENAMTINGVLYPVTAEDLPAYDAREVEDRRVEVPRDLIEPLSWQSLPAAGRIWTYVPTLAGKEPGVGLSPVDAHFPLLQTYVDVVVEGGFEYGPEFAREIVATTADWSVYWLNDRPVGRRPWVADVKYQEVDRLLAVVPQFAERRFPEEFAVKYKP
jgi:hypothetical protein